MFLISLSFPIVIKYGRTLSEIHAGVANRPSQLFAANHTNLQSFPIVIGKTAGSTHNRDLGNVEPFAVDLNQRRRRHARANRAK